MATTPLTKWAEYFEARNSGRGIAEAARQAGIDRSTAYRFERGQGPGVAAAQELGINVVGGQIVAPPLPAEAEAALQDFPLFRRMYFGRSSTPWQAQSAEIVAQKLDSPDREFMVINMPPGSGKSTLFTHDILCWVIARNRNVRSLVGARTERQARMYVSRVKRTLERETPLANDPDLVAKGIVTNATSTLAADYGMFKPEGRTDLWRTDALVVQTPGGKAVDDKEPTVAAYGQDSGFLGGRYDFIVWDDLVDAQNTRTEEALNRLCEWYSTEAETRCEPGGLFLLQGQRIRADDLYRYALDLKTIDGGPKYHHVVFPAHNEDACQEEHGKTAKPWPEGCLLDPYRLPWTFLEQVRLNEPRTFNLMYQQDDEATVGGLLDPVWLEGGLDADGNLTPGCYDDRSMLDIPEQDGWSFITVDPSPSEYWGVMWWHWDPVSTELSLLDVYRGRLTPEQFLYLDIDTGRFSGLLHEWWNRSHELGFPLETTIFEVNAAQKWMLQMPHVQRWAQQSRVELRPHQTNRNKNDAEYGVETLGTWFKHGLVRLPNKTPGDRHKVDFLIKEAKQYPRGRTTDCLMSFWFATLATRTGWTGNKQGAFTMTHSNPNAVRGLAGVR